MYLHEAIIEEIECLIEEGEPFSAWDVTQGVREAVLDADVEDCASFTDKLGDERYNVEHSRVKSLVHLYLKNYDPNRVQQAHGPKYIVYTPVALQKQAPTSTVFDPLAWLDAPRRVLGSGQTDVKNSPNVTFHVDPNSVPVRTTTYIDVGANKDKLTDAQLIEAAKKILNRYNGT